VGFESYKSQMKNFFLKQEVVGQKVNDQSSNRITATTRGIMIGLQGHETPEKRIKNIQHRK
jgi:hypothetical protein